jgi:hypothetical protein
VKLERKRLIFFISFAENPAAATGMAKVNEIRIAKIMERMCFFDRANIETPCSDEMLLHEQKQGKHAWRGPVAAFLEH